MTKQTLTLPEVVEKITSHPSEPEVRVLRRVEIGATVIHQGDVYLHPVADDHPRGKAMPGERQVAVGNTIGSRHLAEGENVKLFEGKKLPPGFSTPEWAKELTQEQINGIFLGPVVTGATRLSHPEHAHHCFPEGTYQVTYQGDPRTAERVRD